MHFIDFHVSIFVMTLQYWISKLRICIRMPFALAVFVLHHGCTKTDLCVVSDVWFGVSK